MILHVETVVGVSYTRHTHMYDIHTHTHTRLHTHSHPHTHPHTQHTHTPTHRPTPTHTTHTDTHHTHTHHTSIKNTHINTHTHTTLLKVGAVVSLQLFCPSKTNRTNLFWGETQGTRSVWGYMKKNAFKEEIILQIYSLNEYKSSPSDTRQWTSGKIFARIQNRISNSNFGLGFPLKNCLHFVMCVSLCVCVCVCVCVFGILGGANSSWKFDFGIEQEISILDFLDFF